MLITGGGLWVGLPGRGCVGDLFRSAGHSGGELEECHLHRSLRSYYWVDCLS